jgi:hypothetical protein
MDHEGMDLETHFPKILQKTAQPCVRPPGKVTRSIIGTESD